MVDYYSSFFSRPFLILNIILAIISSYWIFTLGDYDSLVVSLFIFILASFFGGRIIEMTILIFITPGLHIMNYFKSLNSTSIGRIVVYPFYILSFSGIWLVIYFWSIIVFDYGITFSIEYNGLILLPYILLSYCVAILPLNFIDYRQQLDFQLKIPLFFNQIGSLWMILGLSTTIYQINIGYSSMEINSTRLVYLFILTIGYIITFFTGELDQDL